MTTRYLGGGDNSSPTTDPGTGGDWSSSHDTWANAISAMAVGDTLIVKADYAEGGMSGALGFPGSNGTGFCYVVTVDPNDTSAFQEGSDYNIQTDAGVIDLGINGRVVMIGLHIRIGDDLALGNFDELYLYNGKLVVNRGGSGSTATFRSSDNSQLVLQDSTFGWDVQDNAGYMGESTPNIHTIGGTLLNPPNSQLWGEALQGEVGNGSMRDLDCSGVTGGGSPSLMPDDIDAGNRLEFTRVKIAAGTAIFSGAMYGEGTSVVAESVDSGDGYQYFEHHYYNGVISEDESIDRQGGATYDGTNLFSALFEPNTDVNIYSPLRFKLAELFFDDLSSDTTLTVYLTSAASLTDTEFWLEIEHPDSTDLALGTLASTRNSDVLATGTTLSAGAQTWNSERAEDYKVAHTISAITSGKGPVTVWACLAKDTDVNVCPKVEVG